MVDAETDGADLTMSSLPTDQAELRLSESITDALTAFSQRRIRLLKLRAVAAGLIALFVTMTIVAIFDYLWWMPDLVRWSLSLIAYLATAGAVLRYGWRRADRTDLKRIARQFESADPRFREDLLSTVELADPALANGSHSFRNWLQDRTGRQMAMVDIGRLLPIDLIRPWLWTAATICSRRVCCLSFRAFSSDAGSRVQCSLRWQSSAHR